MTEHTRVFFLFLPILVGCLASDLHAQSTPDPGGVPWWNRSVFYQVFIRSFADASTGTHSCDGIGDFQGLYERLDYLNDGDPTTTDDLGVTGFWLMPIMESPSYHGYDIVDYYALEQDYGTREDFRRLIDAAHSRGIRVILDLVINHTSSVHPWFVDAFWNVPAPEDSEASHRSWYIFKDAPEEWRVPWGQKVWHIGAGEYYYGLFCSCMPDLNFRNPEVTKAIYKVVQFWLEEMNVDGFRIDAVRHLIEDGPIQQNTVETHEWLRAFYAFYKGLDPEVFTVGEVFDATENVSPYVRDKEMDLAFEFDLAAAILEVVQVGERAPLDRQLTKTLKQFPHLQYGTFLRNHDQSRVMTVLEGNVEQAKLAATLLLTLPGVPFLYYGEEIGMVGPKPDPKIRTPMQWTSGLNADFSECKPWQRVNADFQRVNVESEAALSNSLLNLYRRLIHLRTDFSMLQWGDYETVETDVQTVYAFLRQMEGEVGLVLVNLSNAPVRNYSLTVASSQIKEPMTAKELLHGAAVSTTKLNDDGGFVNYRPILELAPRTGYVIRLAAGQ